MPLCHSSRSSGSTGRTIDGLIPIKNSVSRGGFRINRLSCPLYMADAVYSSLHWMHEHSWIFFIDLLAKLLTYSNYSASGIVFNAAEVFLWLNDRIKIT